MSAPSFSSFPPSFSSFPDLDPGPSKRGSTPKEDAQELKKRKRKDKEDRDRKQSKRRLEGRRHDASHSRQHSEERGYGGVNDETRKAEEDTQMKQDEAHGQRPSDLPLYITDRKGDPLIVQYGGLHTGSVPRYHLVGWGKTILGMESAWKVVRRSGKGVEIAVGGKRKMPALSDSSSRHLLNAPPTRRLLASSEDKYKYDEVEGFIRITSRRDRKDDQSYRSITAPKPDADSDRSASSQEEAESSGDESDTTPVTSLQATLKSLEEQLSSNPSSIPTWLSLLSHTLSTTPISSKNAPKARSEITLSVLSRALPAHPSNASSKILRLRYLKAGEEVWHDSKLRAEWEDALKVGGIEIWMEWLDWRIRRAESGVEGIVDDAKRVFALNERDEVGKLRVLWRVAVGFRDAGYVERSNAVFQAQAELTFHMPSSMMSQPFEQQLDSLEEFWESEVPRAGEPEASGWAHWVETNKPAGASLPSRKTVDDLGAEHDPFRQWASLESLSDRTYQLPTRSFDEAAEADPYATILFSDIRPLLISLRTSHAKNVFRLMWLAFLGLHVPGFLDSLSAAPSENADDRWACGHLVSPAYVSSILPSENISAARRVTADAQAGVLIGREREYSIAFGPVKSWGLAVLGPLEGVADGRWRMWGREDVSGVDQGLVREVFRQCYYGEDVEWEIFSVAFEAACNLKGASKASKAVLAKAQDSYPHWAAHARLERIRGRVDDARRVYQAVLTAGRSKSTAQSPLWWDWAEMEWLAGESEAAMDVIVRSTGSHGTGGIATLRAKRHLQETITQIPSEYWKEREIWIKLSALLELLTSSPRSALSVLDAHLNELEGGSLAQESLTVTSLALLYNYGTVLRNPLPPALLRGRAETAMELYPSNTFILGIFLEAQKGQGIWGRVRAILGESATDTGMREKSLARRVAEVWMAGWEKGRWEAEQERTRGGLSAAVQSERTRGSPTLWRLYLEFEIKSGHLERAKKLLFRAVGECPLVKELYLLAFGPLRPVFSSRELNEWADTMAERGIRMRTGLEEMLEGWGGDREVKMEDDEEDTEDEIEHSARELRRLRPY